MQAVDSFRKYFAKKSKEDAQNAKILERYKNLNLRQIEILQKLLKYPTEPTTLSAYKNIFNITKVTAIKDLKELLAEDFVLAKKKGRNVFYFPTEKLKKIDF